jgi:YfiH family protein
VVASTFLFTSRSHGVSKPPFDQRNLALHVGDQPELVMKNRHDLAREIGLDPGSLYFMNQVHGSEVIQINPEKTGKVELASALPDAGAPRECDALITRTPGVGLAVLVADCAPVIFMGEQSSAVIHVGWRGLFAGIVEKVALLMSEERFRVHVGPTICGNCYEIGDDLRMEAVSRNFVITERGLDIPSSIAKILKSNYAEQMIEFDWNGICTFEDSEYFSFRRSGVTGRSAGVVVHGS